MSAGDRERQLAVRNESGNPVLRWPDPRPQPIRDMLLAYLATPRVVRDIARHICRPVPTTTGHLAAMRRLGLVERFGFGVYGLPGYQGPIPAYTRPHATVPATVRSKVRAVMREPITFQEIVARTNESADLVRLAVHALWMSGMIAGDEKSDYRPTAGLRR